MGRKYRDQAWDFIRADTKRYTHNFHAYPGMLVPQITARLLDSYATDGPILDPYCGTGSVLVEANLRGLNAVGFDLNPLARLISRVKTTPIDLGIVDDMIANFRSHPPGPDDETPDFKNIEYWFAPSIQKDLAGIQLWGADLLPRSVKEFFQICFSETVREVSWTRNSEFKLLRMTASQMERWSPDVNRTMLKKLDRNRTGLADYMIHREGTPDASIHDFNTVYRDPHEVLEEEIDMLVTSPPYGDSRTTLAYGQFSRLANQWLGVENASQLDNEMMGGRVRSLDAFLPSATLEETHLEIAEKDAKRARDVQAFFGDYYRSIEHIAPNIRDGGHVAYVVGNRRVKGVTIPMDEITRHFWEDVGFSHLKTVVRNIQNKRLPSKNSPTNVTGKLDTTMRQEFIVVMKKS